MNDKKIYEDVLLDHNLHPQYKRKITGVSRCKKVVNASCGDKLEIELKIQDGVVVDGGFSGVGCAISQASADLMLGVIIGKTEAEVNEIKKIIERLIVGKNVKNEELVKLGEAKVLTEVSRMPARVKCAKLPWQGL